MKRPANLSAADAARWLIDQYSHKTASGCWEIHGLTTDKAGYVKVYWHGANIGIQRLVWMGLVGDIPAGVGVGHLCHNQRCVNPDHLRLETDSERKERGKAAGRYRTPAKKLTPDQVREIRRRAAAGETQAALGLEFGVSDVMVNHIVHRRTWKNID